MAGLSLLLVHLHKKVKLSQIITMAHNIHMVCQIIVIMDVIGGNNSCVIWCLKCTKVKFKVSNQNSKSHTEHFN